MMTMKETIDMVDKKKINRKNSLWEIIQMATFIFSSQIGSGFFLLPSLLSRGGYLSFLVLAIVGLLAMITIHVFAQTGMGVAQIIEKSFGKQWSRIIYFIYWFISWFSTIVLFKELIGYTGLTEWNATLLEISIWFLASTVNLWKLKYTVYIESMLTIMKFLPFIFLIIGYFISFPHSSTIINFEGINIKLFLRCMWLFVGIETGNIIGSNLEISKKNKKIGTYVGMSVVVLFYLISIIISFFLVGNSVLQNNMAPYFTMFLFAYKGLLSSTVIDYTLKLLVVLTLVGSINSWTISSGYTAKECGEMGILPKVMMVKNRHGVPYVGIFVSSILVLIFLLLCNSPNIYQITTNAIDISCCFFLLIYGMCLMAYGKSYVKKLYVKLFFLFIYKN